MASTEQMNILVWDLFIFLLFIENCPEWGVWPYKIAEQG